MKHSCRWCRTEDRVQFKANSSGAFAAHLFLEHTERLEKSSELAHQEHELSKSS